MPETLTFFRQHTPWQIHRSESFDLEAYECQISNCAGPVSVHIAAIVPDSGKCSASEKAGTAPNMHHFRK